MVRLAGEAVEGDDAVGDGGQAAGEGRIGGVGVVDPAPDLVIVDLGAEGRLHLGGAAAEVDPSAAGGDLVDREAVVPQPGDRGLDVVFIASEALPELLGGEPAVIVRGGGVLLVGEQPVELPLGPAPEGEREDHPLHGQARVGAPAVELRPGQPVDVVGQDDAVGVVDGGGRDLGRRAGGQHAPQRALPFRAHRWTS